MIYCDERDPEKCAECKVIGCDNKPLQRGEVEIRSLAESAIERLNDPKNAKKGDWKEETISELCDGLDEEVRELFDAIYQYRANPCEETQQRVREEAGDVVNEVMMLADLCGALEEHRWEGTD